MSNQEHRLQSIAGDFKLRAVGVCHGGRAATAAKLILKKVFVFPEQMCVNDQKSGRHSKKKRLSQMKWTRVFDALAKGNESQKV